MGSSEGECSMPKPILTLGLAAASAAHHLGHRGIFGHFCEIKYFNSGSPTTVLQEDSIVELCSDCGPSVPQSSDYLGSFEFLWK